MHNKKEITQKRIMKLWKLMTHEQRVYLAGVMTGMTAAVKKSA